MLTRVLVPLARRVEIREELLTRRVRRRFRVTFRADKAESIVSDDAGPRE